jgi:hypothetical protein
MIRFLHSGGAASYGGVYFAKDAFANVAVEKDWPSLPAGSG